MLADVSVGKEAPAVLVPGTHADYILTIKNAGPSTARDIVISDPTPPGMTLVFATAPCEAGFPCTISDLAAGDGVQVIATYALPAAYTGASPIANTAEISSSTNDPDNENDVANAETPVKPAADLQIAKVADGAVVPGAVAVFTITVRNAGPSDAQNLLINDTAPVGLVFDSNSGACADAYPCSVATLAAGGAITIVSRYNAPSGYTVPDPVVNQADVTSDTPDPNGPNAAVATVPLAPEADLTIVKTGPPNATPGQLVVYTVTVTNIGRSDARDVVVSDFGPPDTSFQGNDGDCRTAFPCDFAVIPAGQSRVITSTIWFRPTMLIQQAAPARW